MPDSLTSIGDEAFKKCYSLTDIEFSKNLKDIGENVFSDTPWLEERRNADPLVIVNNILIDAVSGKGEVTIPDNVTRINSSAFNDCSGVEGITIQNSVTSIGRYAFSGCENLKNVTIPDSVTDLGEYAFYKCKKLESIVIPNSITVIEDCVFYRCESLSNITIPDSVTSIGESAFICCYNLRNITIPDSVTSIGENAFYECNRINNIVIPNGVTKIADSTFSNCSGLSNITIPESVTSIGNNAFSDCEAMTDVYYFGSKEKWDEISFGADNYWLTNANIIFDCGHTHSYTETITFEPTCTEEGEKTFTCDCGDTYTETIPAKGHTEVIDKAVPATCTTDGKTEGSHCSVCGEVIKAQTIIKATGHKYDDSKITKQPTCTETGVKTYTCSECGATKTETIKATGHKSSSWIIDKQPAVGVKGSKHKECTVCGKILEKAEIPALSATDISGASVKLSTTSYTYSGKAKKPAVTVTLNGKTLKKNVDYTVKYSSNTAIGKAKVTVTGKGNYKGTVSKTFKILPAKQTIAKITSQKKGFALTWTKDKNVTGYQIQYDVKSDFKSAKSTYVKTNTTYKKTISGLKAKKTYYVRVRSYKTVGGVKYYDSWSAVKSVKTK